ncbi:MAG: hypothetical protein WCQ47_03380 [bacterium]
MLNIKTVFIIYCLFITTGLFSQVEHKENQYDGKTGASNVTVWTNITAVAPDQAYMTVLQNMVIPTFSAGEAPNGKQIRSSLKTNIVGGEDGRNAIIEVSAPKGQCLCYMISNIYPYTNGETVYTAYMSFLPQPECMMPEVGHLEVVIEGFLDDPKVLATEGEYEGTGTLSVWLEGSCCY